MFANVNCANELWCENQMQDKNLINVNCVDEHCNLHIMINNSKLQRIKISKT
jgi:hypothetical protein